MQKLFSIFILVLSILLSFLLCLLAVKSCEWLGLPVIALVPACIISIILYPILRRNT